MGGGIITVWTNARLVEVIFFGCPGQDAGVVIYDGKR